jgi:hypothetical protein
MSQISSKYKKSENALALTSENLVKLLENNPDYPNLPAAHADLKQKLPVFQAARRDALGRDKKMVSIKNDLKAEVLALVQILFDYVAAESKGDTTLILSSGFDVINDSSNNNNQQPAVGIITVELGEAGEATTRVRNVKGVKAYVHQYATEAPGPNTAWIGEGSSDKSYTFKGLSSEKKYWFRVVVIGYNKQRAYSQVVARVIQ